MAKLFPPTIEGIIPAFYSENGTINIIVPFSMNRAVSPIQVEGFAIKIKTVQSSSYLAEKEIFEGFDLEGNQSSISFSFLQEELPLKEGQFYKIQIAYIDNNKDIGYYSTVGVGKYTTKPKVEIMGLKTNKINMHSYDYNGVYSQINGDITERVYSYKFDVYNNKGDLIASSGEQLHNSSNDSEIDNSYDKFNLAQDLILDQNYYIQYTITTINKLTIKSPKYRIMQKTTIEPEIKASIEVALNFENGYVDVKLIGDRDEDGLEEPVTGAFLLSRACDDTKYTVWDEVSRFKLAAQNPSRWLWRDFTVEQGKNYIYALQQYNDAGLYSNRILSNTLYVDYEYAFLYDGERQLKIKYNPKVSTFKNDILETKIDTIGGQHPFIFRNGRVLYKEFPISGLISYFMDEENLFMSEEEFVIKEKTTNLTGSNLMAERTFKLKVLEWLTNGKPKLFRSPTEGNYIVRLMNTSLSPNDTLGRMLHTFTCTAYEVADYNYNELNKYDFIHLTDPEQPTTRWETINFYENGVFKKGEDIKIHPAYTVRFTGMTPGDSFKIYTDLLKDPEEIVIGVTGSYYIETPVSIKKIVLPDNAQYYGSMVYSYYSVSQNRFNKIANVQVAETPVIQFVGEHDIIKEIEYIDMGNNVWEKNPKVDILEFYNIQASIRPVEKVVLNQEVSLTDENQFSLFAIGQYKLIEKYNPNRIETEFEISQYKDLFNDTVLENPDLYDSSIYIDDTKINLQDIETWDWKRPGKLSSLRCGNGAVIEVAYQVRIIDYLIEENSGYDVLLMKQKYLDAVNKFNQHLKYVEEDSYPNDYEWKEKETELRQEIDKTYKEYIKTLIIEQKKEKESEGIL